jgi:hypothetical protein
LLLLALVALALAAGGWGYRRYRAARANGDTGHSEASMPAADGIEGLAEPGAGQTAMADSADPTAAFELDPEQWAPMTHRGQRRAQLRGTVRGTRGPIRLAGEPDVVFEHREGRLAVGLDAARAYDGHPHWREISRLTLQMGVVQRRWPNASVTGVIRYGDCTVALPYKEGLYGDLRRAARQHKDKTLPSAEELSSATDSRVAATTSPPANREPGRLARLREAVRTRLGQLSPRRFQRQ